MRRRELITLLGSAAAWPLAARAQHGERAFVQSAGTTPRLAIVSPLIKISEVSLTGNTNWQIFFRQLASRGYIGGYIEGENLIVDRYSAQGRTETFPELARKAVHSEPNVIFAISGRMVQQLMAVTKIIPIVAWMGDPVAAGIITNLAHPGGNVTGVGILPGPLWEKRLEILNEVVPGISKAGFLASADVWHSVFMTPIREVFDRAGLSLVGPPLGSFSESEYRQTFAAMKQQGVEGLVVSDQPEHNTIMNRRIIAGLAGEAKLPTIYPFREFVDAGGLMAYLVDNAEILRLQADQVSRILGGASPGDLPFQMATKVLFSINLKTAGALGITFPPMLLARADEMIE